MLRRTIWGAVGLALLAGCNSGSRSGTKGTTTAATTSGTTAPTTSGMTAPTTSTAPALTYQTVYTASPAVQDDSVRAIFPLAADDLLVGHATGPIRRLPPLGAAAVLEGSPGSISAIASADGTIYASTGEPFFVRGGGDVYVRSSTGAWTLSLDHAAQSMVVAALGNDLYGFASEFTPGTPNAQVNRLPAGGGAWQQDILDLGAVQITCAAAWNGEMWAGGSDKSNVSAAPRLFRGSNAVFASAPLPSSAGPNEIELVSALLPSGPTDLFIATIVVDSLTGFVVRGNVIHTADGTTYTPVATAQNDAPTALAWHDNGLMIGMLGGQLFHVSNGVANTEQVPVNNGIMSLFSVANDRLLIGVRGTAGAELFARQGSSTQASAPTTPAAARKTYVADVKGVLRTRCLVCHGVTGNPAQANYALSSGLSNDAADYAATRAEVTAAAPETSLLLTKALNSNNAIHGGGAIFASTADPDYVTLLQWIRDGSRLQ